MPKPDAARRRRNAPTTARKAVPSSGRRARAPQPAKKLPQGAARFWRRYWKLPIAELWTDADIPAVTRLCWLQDAVYSVGALDAGKLLTEVRQLEDRLGLNLQARERLGVYEVDDAPEPPGQAPAEGAAAAPGASRFGELRVVE
ncbi:MAG: hypothetical protein ACF8PN_04980 [Phycisphaerales bacterium]